MKASIQSNGLRRRLVVLNVWLGIDLSMRTDLKVSWIVLMHYVCIVT